MQRLSPWPIGLGLSLALIVVTLIQPTEHSLAIASGILCAIGLMGWVAEARDVAGPPPPVELDHGEEEEEEAPGPSLWPLVVAAGVVGIGAGLVYSNEYLALIVALPLAIASAALTAKAVQTEREAAERGWATARAAMVEQSMAGGGGGGLLMPLPPRALAAQAAGGAAIAIEIPETQQVSRRNILRITFWSGMGAGLLAFAGTMIDMLYPRNVTGFGSVVSAGVKAQFPPGTKTPNAEGKFWIVNLTEEQAKASSANGKAGFLALWWKCPHLGCTVPWRPDFVFPNPNTLQDQRGWFRCPCHGSTYDNAGVRVYGPAPRSMDRMAITIDPGSGRISVNTGRITKGDANNAEFSVPG